MLHIPHSGAVEGALCPHAPTYTLPPSTMSLATHQACPRKAPACRLYSS